MKVSSINNDEAIRRIKEVVRDVFDEVGIGVERIILFGSRARGDYDEGSDFDFLVVVNRDITRDEKMRLTHLINMGLARYYIPCDVLIKSRREVEDYRDFFGTATYEALREGVEI